MVFLRSAFRIERQEKKGYATMKDTTLKRVYASVCCMLLLAVLLLMTACGGSSSPGSSPNNPPPTKGGYSIITLFERDMQVFDHAMQLILTL